CARSLAYW
nr:immunoglobulin heavy chain junction region [Mus musculus]